MRIRNVKKAFAKIENYEKVIWEPDMYKGKWNQLFKNNNPIHIEVGMGKGQFILEMARRNPAINYIGVERFTVIVVKALEKIEEDMPPDNLYVIRLDAEDILTVFEEEEVSKIYLNFSDPWPKAKHNKRRLTHKNYLDRYNSILIDKGLIQLKTDNDMLFEFSIESINDSQFNITKSIRNLHASGLGSDNVMTEYEEKFSEQGILIKLLEARK